MKKFFSYFCYVAMAVAAVSFVSCGDDDDIDDPKKEPTTNGNEVQIYAATIGDQVLDVFDIKLNMYRNGQKQVVVLNKSMIAKSASTIDTEFQSYYCSSVNGVEGVDSVIAEVEVKPNAEEYMESQDPDGRCTWMCQGYIMKVAKAANDDYSKYCTLPIQTNTSSWYLMLRERRGEVFYKTLPDALVSFLSDKSVH